MIRDYCAWWTHVEREIFKVLNDIVARGKKNVCGTVLHTTRLS